MAALSSREAIKFYEEVRAHSSLLWIASKRLDTISLGAHELHLRVVLLLSPFYSREKGDTEKNSSCYDRVYRQGRFCPVPESVLMTLLFCSSV